MLFETKQLNYSYSLGTQNVAALDSIDIQIPEGEFCCLIGPSGSGKSTLLQLLGFIVNPEDHQLYYKGQDVSSLRNSELNKLRKYELGFIFQNFQLIDVLTVAENIEYFLTRQGVAKEQRKNLVSESLEFVGLSEYRDRPTTELSGGQRQRVAIARAIAKKPKVIIADEPTASLDQKTGHEIMNILETLNQDTSVSIIAASHDPMAMSYANRIIELRDGEIQTPGNSSVTSTSMRQKNA